MKEVKEQNEKKNLPTSYRAGVTAKQIRIWPVQRLITGANEAVVTDQGIIVTSSFSETKGVFCFSFNKRSLEDALGKMCFFAYVISQKGSKLQGKNMQNIV